MPENGLKSRRKPKEKSKNKVKMLKSDYFLAERPLLKGGESGDVGIIKEFDTSKVFMAIIDALGHGKDAHKVAVICKDFLEKNYGYNLLEIIYSLHDHIKGLRGAVAGLCLLDLIKRELRYVGVGDITLRKFGSDNISLISRPGIIGYKISTPKEEVAKILPKDVLILYTDGIKSHFDLEDYPVLLKQKAKFIAKQIVDNFGRKNDDAACIVFRFWE